MADNNQQNSDEKFRKSLLRAYGVYMGAGLSLVLSILGGGFGGKIIDDKLSTSPLFLLVGFGLGTAAGFYNLILTLKREKEASQDDGKNHKS